MRERATGEGRGESRCLVMCGNRVSEGFSARCPLLSLPPSLPPKQQPRLDKYIVEFNIPSFFFLKGSRPTVREKGARVTQKRQTNSSSTESCQEWNRSRDNIYCRKQNSSSEKSKIWRINVIFTVWLSRHNTFIGVSFLLQCFCQIWNIFKKKRNFWNFPLQEEF